jgi:hypothetical protein
MLVILVLVEDPPILAFWDQKARQMEPNPSPIIQGPKMEVLPYRAIILRWTYSPTRAVCKPDGASTWNFGVR